MECISDHSFNWSVLYFYIYNSSSDYHFISSPSLYFLLEDSNNKSLLYITSHDIYILFMVMVSFNYIYIYIHLLARNEKCGIVSFIHLSYIIFSSQWRIC